MCHGEVKKGGGQRCRQRAWFCASAPSPRTSPNTVFQCCLGRVSTGTSCQENVAKRPPDPFFVLVQNLGLDGWQIDQVLTRSATQTQILYQKKKTTRPNEIGWVLGLPAVLICVVGLGQFAATQADHSNFVPEEKKDQGGHFATFS